MEMIRDKIVRSGYESCIPEIEKLAYSDDVITREELAILLVEYVNLHSERILIRLLNDQSISVRIEAADSLSVFKTHNAYVALKKCSEETRNPTLRGYALSGLGYVADGGDIVDALHYLESVLKNEKNTFVKLQSNFALCMLGKRDYLTSIFTMFSRCGYRNKCVIINILMELLEENRINPEDVRGFIKESRKYINCIAVEHSFGELELIAFDMKNSKNDRMK